MISVDQLSVRSGSFALDQISFYVPTGRYAVLMGKTGCGKTTIMEAICGLRSVVSGRIVLMNVDVTKLKPAERGIGFVPQDTALFPTMSVFDQLGFALSVRKKPRRAIRERVHELAALLDIEHLLNRYPTGLSGGERQRVALGRALAAKPSLLCLDEPLSALDESTREEMYELLRSVQRSTGVTALHITHSRREAELLADVVLRLHDGRLDTERAAESPSEDSGEVEFNESISEDPHSDTEAIEV